MLTHAVESYVTWAYNNNFTNRCAEEATVKVFRYLEQAYADGNDIDAREQMLIASYKAGLAFIAAIRAMNKRMGLPTGFDFIRQEDYDQIIMWALDEANKTYPVPVAYNDERCRHVLNRIVLEA